MKIIIALAAVAVLSACSQWTAEQNKAAITLAVSYVQEIDLTEPLDAKDRAKLQFVCDLSAIQYPEYADVITTACDSIEDGDE